MRDREKQLYELALKTGKEKFRKECQHTKIKEDHCMKYLRKIK